MSWYDDGGGVVVDATGVLGSRGDRAGELGERGEERGETERIGESGDDTAAGAGGVISGSGACGCRRCGSVENCKELVVEEEGDAVGGGRGRAQVGGGPAGVTRSGISSAGLACGRGGRAGYRDDDDDNGERAVRPGPLSLELVLRRSAAVSGMVDALLGAPKRILDGAVVVMARRSCRGVSLLLVVGALAGARGYDIVVV